MEATVEEVEAGTQVVQQKTQHLREKEEDQEKVEKAVEVELVVEQEVEEIRTHQARTLMMNQREATPGGGEGT